MTGLGCLEDFYVVAYTECVVSGRFVARRSAKFIGDLSASGSEPAVRKLALQEDECIMSLQNTPVGRHVRNASGE